MAVTAPNASHHHTAMGIKGEDLTKAQVAQPLVSIRQTGFEDGNEISTETDEGHTGVSNLDMGSFRTKAESSPSWDDGIRFAQGIEDYLYLLLAHDDITAHTTSGLYNHHFAMPSNTEDELPFATIYHGFSKTLTDGRIFNNAMLNEFEMTFNADDKPTVSPTFVSDYNIVNTQNPPRDFLPDHLARTVMAPHTKVYIGPVGATEIWDGTGSSDGKMVSIDCFSEASWTVNNNAESQACHDDKFGENTKLMGQREVTGSITMPWHEATKYFETEYEAYEKYGHIVSEEITQKQVWYQHVGGNIHVIRDNNTLGTGETLIGEVTVNSTTKYEIATGVPYSGLYKFPVCEVTNVTSPKSGSDAKDLTFEWKGIEQPDQSYLIADLVSDLAALHIDDGTIDSSKNARSAWYPPLKDGQGQDIAANQKFAPYKDQ